MNSPLASFTFLIKDPVLAPLQINVAVFYLRNQPLLTFVCNRSHCYFKYKQCRDNGFLTQC